MLRIQTGIQNGNDRSLSVKALGMGQFGSGHAACSGGFCRRLFLRKLVCICNMDFLDAVELTERIQLTVRHGNGNAVQQRSVGIVKKLKILSEEVRPTFWGKPL